MIDFLKKIIYNIINNKFLVNYLIKKEESAVENIIEIKNLYKSFGDIKAVDNLSFKVKKGELFAFLGVNGAGKSTTISMICGQLKKDSGEITIDGKAQKDNMAEIKNALGVVFQNSLLDKQLTVKDNLKFRAALYGISGREFEQRLCEVAELLDAGDILKRPVNKLSGGQRRKADIARAIFHKPRILILDEPTTGLDPQTRKKVWQAVDTLRKNEQMTVILTTHYMEEASEADYVIIIDSGKICAEGTPLELKNKYTGDFITIYGSDEKTVSLLSLPYTKIGDNNYRLSIPNTEEATKLIQSFPAVFRDYEITKGKMDDVFLASTGKKTNGGGEYEA